MQCFHKISSTLFKNIQRPHVVVKYHNLPVQSSKYSTFFKQVGGVNIVQDENRTLVRLHHRINNNNNRNLPFPPKTPELIYIPRVFRWMTNKLRFKYLQKVWDQDFSEGAFIFGSTKAICRITEIVHTNDLKELEGLMTRSARSKLVVDMHTRLSAKQKSIIELRPGDIKILVPVSVKLTTRDGEQKCKINLRVLALKWYKQINGVLNLVLVALQTEFLRDYKDPCSDWTISNFDVLDCTMLKEGRVQ